MAAGEPGAQGGPGYSVADVIRKGRIGRGSSDAEALVFLDRRVTFGELDQRSDRLAAGLSEAGFAKGDRAAILAHNSVEFVEAFFAVAKLGGVLVPINYLLRPPEIEYLLRDSGATWLFADAAGLQRAAPVLPANRSVRVISMDGSAVEGGALDFDELVASTAPAPRPGPVTPDDLLLLQYTSGTTGSPKGAVHTHGTVLFNSLPQLHDFSITADDVYVCVPALCWAAGLHNVVLALWSVGGRVLLRPSGNFDADALCAAIAAERGTVLMAVASVLRMLVVSGALERQELPDLRLVAVGGEPVAPSLLEEARRLLPNTEIAQVYGQSEFPTLMAYLPAERALEKPASTGKSTSLCELRVLDPSGEEVAPGEHGEIVCRSPATMKGYWNKPEETRSTIVDGWMWTGDRGYYDEDGFLYIAGRSKEMYISGGLNVYPAEVEIVLVDHPEIAETAVIGIDHEMLGEVGCAFLVCRGEERPDEAELERFCRERLATFKVPRAWVWREEALPRTASGKIEKHRLVAEAESISVDA